MTTQKFNSAYTNANSLTLGSKFDYVGVKYTVTGFTKDSIIATSANKVEKIRVFDFEGYIYYGFLKVA